MSDDRVVTGINHASVDVARAAFDHALAQLLQSAVNVGRAASRGDAAVNAAVEKARLARARHRVALKCLLEAVDHEARQEKAAALVRRLSNLVESAPYPADVSHVAAWSVGVRRVIRELEGG